MSNIKPMITKQRYECRCRCPQCLCADDCGHGHCEDRKKGCHVGELVSVPSPSEPGRKSRRPVAPPKNRRRRHGHSCQVVPFPDTDAAAVADLGPVSPEAEYKVSVLCLDPADQREMNDLVSLTARVDAVSAMQAAEFALNKLGILWQGSDGTRSSKGIGPFGYLVCDRETNIWWLVWAHDEASAKSLAEIPDHRVRYCTLVTVEKIPCAM